MTKIKLPHHLEGSRTYCPQPEYRHRGEFSDPSDTPPDPLAAHSKERFSYLYEGGKWIADFYDDEIFNGNE